MIKKALIQESACIGCARCIAVCPTDAIIGTQEWMHTVVESLCIGCDLCVPVCPVDCIAIYESAEPTDRKAFSLFSKKRIQNRLTRLAKKTQEQEAARQAHLDPERKKALLQATLAKLKKP